MSDINLSAPVQPDNSVQQANASSANSGENWESRYKGASQKINELTVSLRQSQESNSVLTSQIEQLKQQLSIKDVEKDIAVGEHSKRLSETLTRSTEMESELKRLRANDVKLQIARKLKAPQLVNIMDRIPNVDDPEVQESIMKDFIQWGDNIAKEREAQLMAGITPTIAATSSATPTLGSRQEWDRAIAELPDGPAKNEMYQRYFAWMKGNTR